MNSVRRLHFAGRRLGERKLLAGEKGRVLYAPLTHRALIRIKGVDALPFLQGLVTADVMSLTQPARQSLYGLMLNADGRVRFDLLFYKLDGDPCDLLVECERDVYADVAGALSSYRLRKSVELFGCGDSLTVFAAFPTIEPAKFGRATFDGGDVALPAVSRLVEWRRPTVFCSDPRLGQFGARLVLPNCDVDELLADEAELRFDGQSATDLGLYHETRYFFGLPEGLRDIPQGKALPLHCNADYLSGVSFHKGCYIGQELTARTHHTGVVRKRLMPLQLLDEGTEKLKLFAEAPLDSRVLAVNDEGNVSVVGKFRSAAGRFGLALERNLFKMRLEGGVEAKRLMLEVDKMTLLPVRTAVPFWWPKRQTAGGIRGFNAAEPKHQRSLTTAANNGANEQEQPSKKLPVVLATLAAVGFLLVARYRVGRMYEDQGRREQQQSKVKTDENPS